MKVEKLNDSLIEGKIKMKFHTLFVITDAYFEF